MAAMSNYTVKKLLGRSNYHSWAFAVQNLLELEELWDCVKPKKNADGVDVPPEPKLDMKARNKIVLLVD